MEELVNFLRFHVGSVSFLTEKSPSEPKCITKPRENFHCGHWLVEGESPEKGLPDFNKPTCVFALRPGRNSIHSPATCSQLLIHNPGVQRALLSSNLQNMPCSSNWGWITLLPQMNGRSNQTNGTEEENQSESHSTALKRADLKMPIDGFTVQDIEAWSPGMQSCHRSSMLLSSLFGMKVATNSWDSLSTWMACLVFILFMAKNKRYTVHVAMIIALDGWIVLGKGQQCFLRFAASWRKNRKSSVSPSVQEEFVGFYIYTSWHNLLLRVWLETCCHLLTGRAPACSFCS